MSWEGRNCSLVCWFWLTVFCSAYQRGETGTDQRGQEQTTDSQDCRKDHWCQPALHSRLIHFQSQETGRKHHCRFISPRTQPVPSPIYIISFLSLFIKAGFSLKG